MVEAEAQVRAVLLVDFSTAAFPVAVALLEAAVVLMLLGHAQLAVQAVAVVLLAVSVQIQRIP